jgi:hypothetical protein
VIDGDTVPGVTLNIDTSSGAVPREGVAAQVEGDLPARTVIAFPEPGPRS